MKKGILFEAVVVLLLIFLIFILYVMVTANTSSQGQWSMSGFQVTSDFFGGSMYIGPNNVLYVITGDKVDALSPAGNILWQVPFPAVVGEDNDTWMGEEAAFDNGTIYLLATPSYMYATVGPVLLAISDSGTLLWYKQLNQDTLTDNPTNARIASGGGQLYLHTGDVVSVYSGAGKLLWDLSNVNAGWAVDAGGDLYTMPGDGVFKSVNAYSPNGSLKWEYVLGNDSFSQDYSGGAGVTYYNNTIYAVLGHALLALDENGSLMWKKSFDGAYVYMDMAGDKWYIQNIINENNGASNVYVVDPEGNETMLSSSYSPFSFDTVCNNTFITRSLIQQSGNISLNDLDAYRIDAYNIYSGREVWNYTISPEKTFNTTLDESDIANVMYEDMTPGGNDGDAWDAVQTNMLPPEAWYQEHSLPDGYEEIRNSSEIFITPWDGGVYVSYWAYNFQYPFFFNQSWCVYGGGLYAFNNNGTLLWEKSTDSRVTGLVANNSTVYYSTKTGGLFAGNTGVAAGLAIAGILYVSLRFFLAGAVTRARGIVDKNVKRNAILKFITDNPGASLYDIAKALKINMGTTRYHLMILSINRRVVSCKADEKYVRYFTNAGSFSHEQRLLVSMMRREGVKKLLTVLLEKPGLSNIEISRELGLQESAASRYMKELLEKGIVNKEQTGDGRLSYSIKNEYREPVELAARRLGGTDLS